jgi:hypothetical protein
MVAKGNKDGHRRSMSGLRVEEAEKWGRQTARERYGALQQPDNMAAKNTSRPQFAEDKQGPGYDNEVPVDSWLRGGGEKGWPPGKGRK